LSKLKILPQSLQPTPEFRKQHAYETLKHFPELKKSLQEFDKVNLELGECQSNSQTAYSLNRVMELTRSDASAQKSLSSSSNYNRPSIRVLDDLKKSSVGEISALSDFKKILVETRRASKISQGLVPGLSTTKDFTEVTFSRMTTATEFEDSSSVESRPQSVESICQSALDPLQRANDKVARVSASLDLLRSGAANPLEGFYGTAMDKNDFAQALRRCLNVRLSRQELDALFASLDVGPLGC